MTVADLRADQARATAIDDAFRLAASRGWDNQPADDQPADALRHWLRQMIAAAVAEPASPDVALGRAAVLCARACGLHVQLAHAYPKLSKEARAAIWECAALPEETAVA
jgi:hypothetical protein